VGTAARKIHIYVRFVSFYIPSSFLLTSGSWILTIIWFRLPPPPFFPSIWVTHRLNTSLWIRHWNGRRDV
jgi:hypothetical protein